MHTQFNNRDPIGLNIDRVTGNNKNLLTLTQMTVFLKKKTEKIEKVWQGSVCLYFQSLNGRDQMSGKVQEQ